MSKNYKNPPALDEKKSYEQWKTEIQLWEIVTDLEKSKRGPAIALSMCGKPREMALEITIEELSGEDGVKKLLIKLDSFFERDKADRMYSAYTDFESCKKTENIVMNDYIVEFEQKYNVIKKYSMELPEPVVAFKLLDNANLGLSEKQLVLTACRDLTFESMKSALRRIFGGRVAVSLNTDDISVKQETVYYTTRGNQGNFAGRRRGYRRGGGNSRYDRYDPNDNLSGSWRANQNKSPSTNPIIKGEVSRCTLCDSKMHWRRYCPHGQHVAFMTEPECKDGDLEEVHMTLMASVSKEEVFMAETDSAAVIDTACTKTVCGRTWLQKYINRLNERNMKLIDIKSSQTGFRFGDGNTVYSRNLVTFPALIGSKSCNIECEVIDKNIPLLLSKSSLKKAEAVLDLRDDRVSMFGEQVNVHLTSSGHYCLDIQPRNCLNHIGDEEILLVDSEMTSQDLNKVVFKLHRQFGHASFEKLITLLKSANNGVIEPEVRSTVLRICSDCKVCHVNSKIPPRPVVAFSLASDFNEIVSLDLHQLGPSIWYLHVIDVFSRFSAAAIIRSKEASVIIENFMRIWVSVFGAPEIGVFTDNGGEFNNEQFREMAESFNMTVKTTPAYSPWSNGVVERHNATLTNALIKLKEDINSSWEIALSWAVSAKNSLHSVFGYSPYQIVFGRNPKLPSILSDKPPALGGSNTSKIVAANIRAIHEGRKAFIASESSEKIRRALRSNIRPKGEHFLTGDRVYYLRDGKWKGPGTVIGQDNVVVFVRHGGLLVRVHSSRLLREKDSMTSMPTAEAVNDTDSDTKTHRKMDKSGNIDIEQENVQNNENDSSDSDSDCSENNNDESMPILHTPEVQLPTAARNEVQLKKGTIVSFNDGSNIICGAKILGRAGKSTGKNKNWYNIEYKIPDSQTGKVISVDFGKVENLQITDSGSKNTIVETHDRANDDVMTNVADNEVLIVEDVFKVAKEEELKSWHDQKVFVECEDVGQKCISTRWVCTIKCKDGSTINKARLVARGFEEDGLNELEKYSPTCSRESLRVILAIIAGKFWKIHAMDIKTAFLQGEQIERDVYLKPPKEANCLMKLWHLKKCVYGLSDASLNWYNRVSNVLLKLGATISKLDRAIFLWHKDSKLIGIMAIHVDDFLWSGNESFKNIVVEGLRKEFNVGKEECGMFKYLGLNLCQNELGNIRFNQNDYINSISKISIDRSLEKNEPLNAKEKTILRSKIGQLLWISGQTRPDIAFDVSCLASAINGASAQNLLEANRIVTKVKSTDLTLNFFRLKEPLSIVMYSDASFGNLPDGGSQGGQIILLVGVDGRCIPLIWQSKKLRRIARSTFAAELMSLAEGIDMAIYVSQLFSNIEFGNTDRTYPIKCIIDNKDLYESIMSNKPTTEKRLRLEISSIRELLKEKVISNFKWIESSFQLADALTKKGVSPHSLLNQLNCGKLS